MSQSPNRSQIKSWLSATAVVRWCPGVEHLLRDVKDSSVGSLAGEVSRMTIGLRGLKARLAEVQDYLRLVVSGTLPVNHDIIYELQARALCIGTKLLERNLSVAFPCQP